ncbi:MAG: hypothetical protein HQM10_26450 [Candidatus Riflebacteria bacterium]|nr:hypothetical protein [Candidatus Riflebacteria bacterium]
MKSWSIIRILSICAAVVIFSTAASALDPLYERNGEVYVLIGDGAKKGVYRLNNPSGEAGITTSEDTPLYDPGSSYGISVNLDRHIFTFTEDIEGGYSLLGGNISVQMKNPASAVLQGYHYDHRGKWGEQGWAMYTTGSGGGNGAFTINYVTLNGNWGSIPNGQWYQSIDNDTHGRPGKCYRDRVEGKAHNYNLREWYPAVVGNTPINQGKRAESYEKRIDRAILGSCIDPCGTNQSQLTVDADPQYVSLAISSMGRVYCYTRTQSSISDGKVTLNNAAYTGNIIPPTKVNDLTTKWVGVSLRDTGNDFVYVLGSQVIKEWLISQGATIPAGFNVTAVAVSDQWSLQGGNVYAYNSSNGMAYQFNKKDNADGTEGSVTYFRGVNLGLGIDDIKADGFGNMFFGKTGYFPASASGFTPADAATVEWTSVSTDMNRAVGRVVFNQKVKKSVFRLGLGSLNETHIGGVNLGNDKWEQYFRVPLTLPSTGQSYNVITASNYSTYASKLEWTWIDSLPKKDPTPSVAIPTRVQIGVINVATPPKVHDINGSKGNIDIVGPLTGNTWLTTETPQGLYEFKVENNPQWESDDRNKRYYDPLNPTNIVDTNGNGFLGGFVSTVSKSGSSASSERSDHVQYEWAIYQIQDAYGNVESPAKLVKKSGTLSTPAFTDSPTISHYFKAGVYQIMCRAKYRWYNYNTLPYGSTITNKGACLTPGTGNFDVAQPAPTPAAVNAGNYPGLEYIPSGAVVQILKINLQSNPEPNVTTTRIMSKLATDPGSYKAPSSYGSPVTRNYHVVNEGSQLKWKLEDESLMFTLPTVTDSNKIGDVRWTGPAYYTWTLNLTLPGNNLYPSTLPSLSTADPGVTNVQFALNIPTEPVFGKILCNAYREFEYDYMDYDSEGNPLGVVTRGPMYVKYKGEVDVLVRDKTPPEIISVNAGALPGLNDQAMLKGKSGLALDDASIGNPGLIEVLVRDNNPFANYITTCDVPGISSHSPNLQMATFFYERGAGKDRMPVASLATLLSGSTTIASLKALVAANTGYGTISARALKQLLWYSSPGLDGVADTTTDGFFGIRRERLTVPAGSTYSEMKYSISVSSIKDFSDNLVAESDVNHPKKLPLNFANNSVGYGSGGGCVSSNHEGYAMIFDATDACGHSVPSTTYLGRLDIIDQHKPALWLVIRDMKRETAEMIPFDVTNSGFVGNEPAGKNLSLIGPDYNILPDVQDWQPNSSGFFPTSCFNVSANTFAGLPVPPLADLSGLSAAAGIHPFELEDGVEIIFNLKYSDNIGIASDVSDSVPQNRPGTAPQFRVTGPHTTSMYYKADSSDISIPTGDLSSFRTIFRDPGVYQVTARVEDTARSYSNPLAANATANHNFRTLKFGLIVVPTTMDIRVIDKSMQRK